MKKKKILFILFIFITLLITACGKTNESKKEVRKPKEKEEEKINVSGTYFIYTEDNIPAYNEYLTLNEDMSFDRQASYCAGITHVEGTYEVKKEDSKVFINLKPNNDENNLIPVEYKEDKILLDKEKYANSEDQNEAIANFIQSCSNFNSPMIFHKGDSSQIDYIESIYADAYIGANE